MDNFQNSLYMVFNCFVFIFLLYCSTSALQSILLSSIVCKLVAISSTPQALTPNERSAIKSAVAEFLGVIANMGRLTLI